MKVGIVGSRGFQDLEKVRWFVDSLQPSVTVVSGGARGVDSVAEARARSRGLQVIVFEPDWSIGRHAGFLRNADIVRESDVVVAFWDGESKGTADSIAKARVSGKLLGVFK